MSDNHIKDEFVFEAESLTAPGIAHGFFSRRGGVSKGIYAALNCGRGSADERADIEENRRRVAAHFGLASEVLVGPKQCHSPNVVYLTEPWPPSAAPQADAAVTDKAGIALSVLAADCTPILLADPKAGVIGAVHAGWKGAKAGVIEATLSAMESLGASRKAIRAAIGPTISAAAYEIGPEFEAAFLAEEAANARFFHRQAGRERAFFDLPGYVAGKLTRGGIDHCQDLGLCTYKNESLFFSYRRSVHANQTDYGRQISVIVLQGCG